MKNPRTVLTAGETEVVSNRTRFHNLAREYCVNSMILACWGHGGWAAVWEWWEQGMRQ